MSKPRCIPIGTSENLLKGVILLSNCSHSSGMKGVLIVKRLCNNVALLGDVRRGAAE